eukprot:4769978-Heterocapsa_arctica.AAC.1
MASKWIDGQITLVVPRNVAATLFRCASPRAGGRPWGRGSADRQKRSRSSAQAAQARAATRKRHRQPAV